jgi:hypothetical protein
MSLWACCRRRSCGGNRHGSLDAWTVALLTNEVMAVNQDVLGARQADDGQRQRDRCDLSGGRAVGSSTAARGATMSAFSQIGVTGTRWCAISGARRRHRHDDRVVRQRPGGAALMRTCRPPGTGRRRGRGHRWRRRRRGFRRRKAAAVRR